MVQTMDTNVLPDRAPALLVDDHSDVLVTTGAFLEAAGFDVVRAGNGDEALSHLTAGETFALLVTDYAMPGMNGVDLANQARERLPDLKVLIITSYPNAAGLQELPQGVDLLIKPFRRATLIARLKTLFDSDLGSRQSVGSDRGEARQRAGGSGQREREAGGRDHEGWQGELALEDRTQNAEDVRLWADVFRNVGIGVGVVDAASNVIRIANDALAGMHGTNVEALIGARVHDLCAPAERARIDNLCNTADRIGRVAFEADRVREDGSMCSSAMQIASVRGLNGEVLYRIVTVQDTASRRQIEAERDQSWRLHDMTPAQTPSSPPIDWIAAGMWRIACGESCPDSWEGLSDQEKERWRDYATGVVQEWVTSVGGSPWRNRRYA